MDYVDQYNEIFFESRPTPERHILRLSTLGSLCGLGISNVKTARVLEIGCSTGANLLPMACAFPDADFTGIDIASAQIDRANQDIATLNLANIRCMVGDVRQDESLGEEFDYIICHGMLTWVDQGIQRALLAFIERYLKSTGVCYLSFNALPGYRTRQTLWHLVEPVRKLSIEPKDKIRKARDLIRALLSVLVDAHRPYGMQLKEELERNLNRSDAFFAHELLNPFCSSLTLRDFKSMLQEHKLHYLCDALPVRSAGVWSSFPELEQQLGQVLGKIGEIEELADGLFPHSFRGALISKKPASPQLKKKPELIETMQICSPLIPIDEQPDIFSDKTVTFCSPTEQTFDESDRLVKSALVVLRGTWPRPIEYKELLASATNLSGITKPTPSQLSLLRITLIHYFQGNHLELFSEPYTSQSHPSETPEVFAFARLQVARQDWVTTLRHEMMPIDQFDKELIPILNGKNNREAISKSMLAKFQSGALQARSDGEEVSKPGDLRAILAEELQSRLRRYVEQALLIDKSGTNQ